MCEMSHLEMMRQMFNDAKIKFEEGPVEGYQLEIFERRIRRDDDHATIPTTLIMVLADDNDVVGGSSGSDVSLFYFDSDDKLYGMSTGS